MSHLPPEGPEPVESVHITRIEYRTETSRRLSELVHEFLLNRTSKIFLGLAAAGCAIIVCIFSCLGFYRLVSSIRDTNVQETNLLQQAWLEVQADHFANAAALYDTALSKEIDPDNLPYAYGNRGWCYMNLDRNEDAIRDFTAALKLYPHLAFALVDRGIVYHRLGKFQPALADYNAAIATNPNSFDALRNRADIFAHEGKLKEALADLNEAIRCRPEDGDCYVRRGQIYADQNDFDAALASFESAIRLDPEDGQAFWEQAAVFARKNQPDRGIAALDEAIRHRPQSARLYCARGVVYGDREIIEKARNDLDQAIRLNPKFALAYSNRGYVELLLGNWSAALGYATHALNLNPKLTAAHYVSARAYAGEGEYDRAIVKFEDTIRLESEHVWAVVMRALTESYEGNHALAERDLKDALSKYPGAFQSHLIWAWFLATCPDPNFRNGPLALAEARVAMELSHRNPDTLDVLAVSYAEVGDFAEAIQSESEALLHMSKIGIRRTSMEKRLNLFRERKPYRDDVD